MASLAGLLKDRGFKVTGSDSAPYPPMSTQIENLKIPLLIGYKAENLNPKPDFVIVGNVISANNPEAQEMNRLKIPHTSLPKAMGEWIIGDGTSLVISGTHGKTTTTSMLAWVAEVCGEKPGFLIGGIPKNFAQSFRNPAKKLFIIEGDEYDTAYFDKVPKFIHYKPTHSILTSIEFDHADIYKDLQAVKDAFKKLVDLTKGFLIYCGEDKNISDILNPVMLDLKKAEKLFSYGEKLANRRFDFSFTTTYVSTAGTLFEVFEANESLGLFKISMSGKHNILNATSVIALARKMEWDMEKVRKAIETFEGVKRRQEILGEPGGILIIEDFAHHPTAVRETLRGIQSRYPGRKLWAVFEPRSATSRRKVFQKDYSVAFANSNEVLIAPAFDQAKIDEDDRFSSEDLVADLNAEGRKARCQNADEILETLSHEAKSGDVVLIMSNGGFNGIYQKLLQRLS